MLRFLAAIGLLLCLVPSLTFASEISIRPFLIDETLVPRESVTETVKIENNYDGRKVIVYATVNEITVGTDGEIREFVSPVMTDRTNTITSWIEVTRGRIEIESGEQAEIPLKITTHPFAEPGEYHAFIGFVEATKRHVAEERALNGDAQGVVVKITVDDERVDSMRVASMQVDRFVTNPDEQAVMVTVENPGEFTSVPEGELIFYNNRGIEIASAPVNDSGEQIAPGEEKTFAVTVPFDDDLGKFKANLNLQYGANQRASLYDTTTFFMVPIWYLFAFGIGLLALVLLLAVLFRRALAVQEIGDHGDEVTMFVRDGHDPKPKDHDIDLTSSK